MSAITILPTPPLQCAHHWTPAPGYTKVGEPLYISYATCDCGATLCIYCVFDD